MEEWKEIKNFENYEISNYGNVRNKKTGKNLKPYINKSKSYNYKKYLKVTLLNNNIHKHFFIHRLVAIYFIPNPLNLDTIDHIDFNHINNKIENLQWMSSFDNNRKRKPKITE